jgi:hypothetical protein
MADNGGKSKRRETEKSLRAFHPNEGIQRILKGKYFFHGHFHGNVLITY